MLLLLKGPSSEKWLRSGTWAKDPDFLSGGCLQPLGWLSSYFASRITVFCEPKGWRGFCGAGPGWHSSLWDHFSHCCLPALTVERLYLKSMISGFFTPITTGPLFLQHRLLLPRWAIREPSLSFLTTLVPFSPCIVWL